VKIYESDKTIQSSRPTRALNCTLNFSVAGRIPAESAAAGEAADCTVLPQQEKVFVFASRHFLTQIKTVPRIHFSVVVRK
jgi:hypothetical protein